MLGTRGYKDLGNLAAGTSLSIPFEMIAEENISDGYYFPIIHIDLKDEWNHEYEEIIFPIEIRVNNNSLDMIPKNIPTTISQSGATDISFNLMNLRESSLKNIIITPRTIDDVLILPEKIMINQLTSGENNEIHFSIIPNEIGQKKIFFDISYLNGINVHTYTTNINIEIIDSLDVSPIIYSMPSTIEYGKKETIQLKIYNAKSEEITSVIITPTTNVRIIPSQYFIGSMDADDIYSVSFDIDSTDLSINETYDIGFSVSFKQDEIIYETPVIQSSITVLSEQSNGEETMIILTALIIISLVVIYYVYRLRKKKRLKKLVLNTSQND
jgi:hypothetical protein